MLTLWGDLNATAVTVEVMADAIELAEFYLSEASRLADAATISAETAKAEVLRSGYERAVGNMREIADLIQKSNTEALGLLNRRFSEAMDEVRGMVSKKD